METTTILESSRKLINWYKNNAKKATINQLLDCKTMIVTNNFALSEELAEIKSNYNICYFSRKIEFSKKKNELMKTMSAVKADSESTVVNSDIFSNELEHESAAYRLELFIKHSDNVANDIMQRISVLKKEAEPGRQY